MVAVAAVTGGFEAAVLDLATRDLAGRWNAPTCRSRSPTSGQFDMLAPGGWRQLTDDEVDDLLTSQRIVRVAFAAAEVPYVVPLGYVWVDRCLWGTTRRGRKTELAERNRLVSFEVDDSATSVPFEWRSCVGEGRFELVELERFDHAAGDRMRSVFSDNPEWNRREWAAGLADGTSVCWRIVPGTITGRAPVPSLPST